MLPELFGFGLFAGIGIALAIIFLATIFIAIAYRRVVPTNEVHIIQSGKKTISYGGNPENGNTYYQWPTWIPKLGVTRTILPISVFDLELKDYAAYDKGRLPFVIDIIAFFRIDDSNTAAARVANFEQLQDQLTFILQGAVRTILASSDIEDIMQTRATFGESFTREVSEQLKHWGVVPVKNMELMDIRDANQSTVIKNIMEKKKSLIESESRQEVAKNRQAADIAEIEAKRQTDIQSQQALEVVGLRTAEKDQKVGIALEKSKQEVQAQAKITTEKSMETKRVADVKAAEIAKDVGTVAAEQAKNVAVLNAEAEKAKTVLHAEANLETQKKNSEGILAEGTAKAEAEKLILLAPVQAQITLAQEIGNNEGYQKYLISLKQIDANKDVGIEQAKALTAADVKIISNTGSPTEGIKNVTDLFSSRGGQSVASLLEGLAQTEHGAALIDKFLPKAPAAQKPKVVKGE